MTPVYIIVLVVGLTTSTFNFYMLRRGDTPLISAVGAVAGAFAAAIMMGKLGLLS